MSVTCKFVYLNTWTKNERIHFSNVVFCFLKNAECFYFLEVCSYNSLVNVVALSHPMVQHDNHEGEVVWGG